VNGRKRHIAVDTLGLLLTVAVHPANIQDRDGAILVLAKLKPLYCFLQVIFADSAYTGDNLAAICLSLSMTLILVHRLAGVKGFVVLPKRWIVERTLGWLSRQRRLSKDYEELIETSQAIVERLMSGFGVMAGCHATKAAMSAPRRAFPRRRVLWTNWKKPR
jgi:putative transposase